jgi:hypothetical protein
MTETMKRIEADRQLKAYNAAIFADCKSDKQKEMHRSVWQEAYPEAFEEETYVSAEDIALALNG